MMIAYFLEIRTAADPSALHGQLASVIIPELVVLPEAQRICLYAPEQANDPYTQDETPPVATVQIDAASVGDLEAVLASAEFKAVLDAAGDGEMACEAFETIDYAIAGESSPQPRTAALSFNVRYYRPVTDEAAFNEFYLAHHPQILAHLPEIRNVLCYTPVDWNDTHNIPPSDCFLGNEVVFDSLDSFNAAMASDVRHRLREDYNAFPVRPGPNTHYAMLRQDFK